MRFWRRHSGFVHSVTLSVKGLPLLVYYLCTRAQVWEIGMGDGAPTETARPPPARNVAQRDDGGEDDEGGFVESRNKLHRADGVQRTENDADGV